jgi:glutamate racemase
LSIGVFDSGLGGISVLRHVRRLLPEADLIYVADRARAPYGRRPLAEVRLFSEQLTEHLLAEGAGLIVLACNTASAAALHHLRARHPSIPFVGMEPALKPAAALTHTGVVAVLATDATFQGDLFASLVDRYADNVEVLRQPCPGWVELVERGELEGEAAEASIRRHLEPVLAGGADVLVLGCTHFPFLIPLMRKVAPNVALIDPSEAVAQQVFRVASEQGLAGDAALLEFEVSGDLDRVAGIVDRLSGMKVVPAVLTLSS